MVVVFVAFSYIMRFEEELVDAKGCDDCKESHYLHYVLKINVASIQTLSELCVYFR